MPDAIGGNFTVVQVANGGNNQNDPGSEVKSDFRALPPPRLTVSKANLDIQYTLGLTHPTPNIYYR